MARFVNMGFKSSPHYTNITNINIKTASPSRSFAPRGGFGLFALGAGIPLLTGLFGLFGRRRQANAPQTPVNSNPFAAANKLNAHDSDLKILKCMSNDWVWAYYPEEGKFKGVNSGSCEMIVANDLNEAIEKMKGLEHKPESEQTPSNNNSPTETPAATPAATPTATSTTTPAPPAQVSVSGNAEGEVTNAGADEGVVASEPVTPVVAAGNGASVSAAANTGNAAAQDAALKKLYTAVIIDHAPGMEKVSKEGAPVSEFVYGVDGKLCEFKVHDKMCDYTYIRINHEKYPNDEIWQLKLVDNLPAHHTEIYERDMNVPETQIKLNQFDNMYGYGYGENSARVIPPIKKPPTKKSPTKKSPTKKSPTAEWKGWSKVDDDDAKDFVTSKNAKSVAEILVKKYGLDPESYDIEKLSRFITYNNPEIFNGRIKGLERREAFDENVKLKPDWSKLYLPNKEYIEEELKLSEGKRTRIVSFELNGEKALAWSEDGEHFYLVTDSGNENKTGTEFDKNRFTMDVNVTEHILPKKK